MNQYRIYENTKNILVVKAGFSWVGFLFGIFSLLFFTIFHNMWKGLGRLIISGTIGYLLAVYIYLFGLDLISFVTSVKSISGFTEHLMHGGEFILHMILGMFIGFIIFSIIIKVFENYIWNSSIYIQYSGIFFLAIFIITHLLATIFPDIKNISNLEQIYYIYFIIFMIFPVSNFIFGFLGNSINQILCEASDYYNTNKIVNASTPSIAIDLYNDDLEQI